MEKNVKIVPVSTGGSHRTGSLNGITVAEINKILGFKPNVDDDPDKVKFSWGFEVDGVFCGIWDYKGSARYRSFSIYESVRGTLVKVFGDKVSN